MRDLKGSGTPEKEKAWKSFVNYFDNIDEIEIPEDIQRIINSKNFEEFVLKINQNYRSSIKAVTNNYCFWFQGM